MNIGKLKGLFPWVAGLLLVIGSVSLRSHYYNTDKVLKSIEDQRDHYTSLMQDQIKKNLVLSGDVQEAYNKRYSGYKLEQQYMEMKNQYQRQIDLYVRYGTTGEVDFQQERETPKTITKTNIPTMWKGVDTLSSTTPLLKITPIHNLTK